MITEEEKKELEKLIKEITDDAKSVVEDYINNPPTISGSAEIHIHEESPWLDGLLDHVGSRRLLWQKE